MGPYTKYASTVVVYKALNTCQKVGVQGVNRKKENSAHVSQKFSNVWPKCKIHTEPPPPSPRLRY